MILINSFMKKLFLPLIAVLMLAAACNNSAEEKKPTRTKADTLYEEVMDGHNVGMGKMAKLTRGEQEVKRLIDSIGKLPAKAQQLAAPYKTKLDSLLVDLKSAESSMDGWMKEFNIDSATNNTAERLGYLELQKEKVAKVKEQILNSLKNADSVLKKDF